MSLLRTTGWGWFRLPGEARAMANADEAIRLAGTEAGGRSPSGTNAEIDVDLGADSMSDLLSALQASVDAARRTQESRTSSYNSEPARQSEESVEGGAEALVALTAENVSRISEVSIRQLDYWSRTGLLSPSIRAVSSNRERQQLYSVTDIVGVKIIKRLLDAGVSLSNVRIALEHIRARGIHNLADVTLFSDGKSVYEATSSEEVIDLLQRGEGAFGISIGGVVREVSSAITEFPITKHDSDPDEDSQGDWFLRSVG